MVSKFTELVVDCIEPAKVAAFWAEVLGHTLTDEGDDDFSVKDPDGSLPTLLFVRVPERKSVKNRLHIDVNPRDRDQADEVERLIALGARRIDIGQGDVSWVVLADPEDNEFCVLRTRVD